MARTTNPGHGAGKSTQTTKTVKANPRSQKVKLYDARTGETVTMQLWAAEHAYKQNHISKGGRYCRLSEIDTYLTLPKSKPAAKAKEEETQTID